MKKDIKIVAIIWNTKMEVLLKNVEGTYLLPSGDIHEGERLEDAYKRFVLNDTGLHIELLHVVYAMNFDELERITIGFTCVPLKKYKPTKELPEDYGWFKAKDTKKLKMGLPDKEIFLTAYYRLSH